MCSTITLHASLVDAKVARGTFSVALALLTVVVFTDQSILTFGRLAAVARLANSPDAEVAGTTCSVVGAVCALILSTDQTFGTVGFGPTCSLKAFAGKAQLGRVTFFIVFAADTLIGLANFVVLAVDVDAALSFGASPA